MSAHGYTEDLLVEQPAIALFAELGWQTVLALEEIIGRTEPSPRPSPRGRGSGGDGRTALGRETPGEVVLVARLRAALERLNPSLAPEAITAAISVNRPLSPRGEKAKLAEMNRCRALGKPVRPPRRRLCLPGTA